MCGEFLFCGIAINVFYSLAILLMSKKEIDMVILWLAVFCVCFSRCNVFVCDNSIFWSYSLPFINERACFFSLYILAFRYVSLFVSSTWCQALICDFNFWNN